MKKRAARAKQKVWHSWLIRQGCYVGRCSGNLHHCAGASAKYKKIWIGQDFVIPLSYEAHQGIHGIHGIHGDLLIFKGLGLGVTRKEIEKSIFSRLVDLFYSEHGIHPCPPDVLTAIQEYRR